MSRVILLGAGATRGTLGEQAPIASEFGQYLNEQLPDWCEIYPYLAAIVRFLEPRIPGTSEKSWALDKVWGAIDNRVKLRYILGLRLPGAQFHPPTRKKIYGRGLDDWGLAGFELRCVVTCIYGVALDSAIQDAVKGSGTVKMELEQLQPGDCVISFNYDLLVERILEKLKKKVAIANPWLKTTNVNESILLCKPHGSLNWKQWVFWAREYKKTVEILNHPMQENEVDFDPAQNATIQPGIVGPVPFKSEIIFPELQGNVLDFFCFLVEQWRNAIQRISEAEKLIVLGYGFPSEDLHAHYLFAEAAAKRKKNKELEIEVFIKNEQKFKDVLHDYRLFQNIAKINFVIYISSHPCFIYGHKQRW